MDSETPLRLPKIDFSGLDSENPGANGWHEVRSRVMEALELYGCFEAVYDKVTPELREAVFVKAMKEAFSLPLEAKVQNTSDKPFHGYVGQIPGMAYESVAIDNVIDHQGAEKFANLMWPGGNPSFCDTVCSFAKLVSELDDMVRRMVLESLGIERHYKSHIDSTRYMLRLSEYGAPPTQGTVLSMPTHTDMTMMSIVCQHQVEGLQILTKDGKWITPSPNSFTVMGGEALEAWTNGRLQPPYHRVLISGSLPRYSVIFGAHPKDNYIVQAPEELVDEEHPLLFKPYDYGDYLRFCFSDAGRKAKYALKAYCGVGGEEVQA